MEYRITRLGDALAVSTALARQYPGYSFEPMKLKRQRAYRIAVSCRVTGVFLRFAIM